MKLILLLSNNYRITSVNLLADVGRVVCGFFRLIVLSNRKWFNKFPHDNFYILVRSKLDSHGAIHYSIRVKNLSHLIRKLIGTITQPFTRLKAHLIEFIYSYIFIIICFLVSHQTSSLCKLLYHLWIIFILSPQLPFIRSIALHRYRIDIHFSATNLSSRFTSSLAKG